MTLKILFPPGFYHVKKQERLHTELLLKPLRNKKGLTFVGMLVFWILFLNFNQLPATKKGVSLQTLGPSFCVRAANQKVYCFLGILILWNGQNCFITVYLGVCLHFRTKTVFSCIFFVKLYMWVSWQSKRKNEMWSEKIWDSFRIGSMLLLTKMVSWWQECYKTIYSKHYK